MRRTSRRGRAPPPASGVIFLAPLRFLVVGRQQCESCVRGREQEAGAKGEVDSAVDTDASTVMACSSGLAAALLHAGKAACTLPHPHPRRRRWGVVAACPGGTCFVARAGLFSAPNDRRLSGAVGPLPSRQARRHRGPRLRRLRPGHARRGRACYWWSSTDMGDCLSRAFVV